MFSRFRPFGFDSQRINTYVIKLTLDSVHSHSDYYWLFLSITDLPKVFKSSADHSSLRLSFCSLPAKVPLVTVLAGLLLFLFDGLQGAYGGYLYTYAVKSEVDFSSSHAAYLNSLFWVGENELPEFSQSP